MAAKLIDLDSKLYVDNGDGSYSEVKWCDLQSATLECECNLPWVLPNEAYYREKIKLLLGENHYREKPGLDIPSQKDIRDQIYRLLSSHNQDLSEFGVSVIHYKNPIDNSLKLTILLKNYVYQTNNEVSMMFFDSATPEEIQAAINTNIYALVMKYLADIKTKNKIYNKKENDIMAQYQYTCKTQEEIELEEKLAKLRTEYDKKATKLREEYKTAKEKKERDAKAKEIHDKYQSLIDSGFSPEQAYDILKTKLGEFTF